MIDGQITEVCYAVDEKGRYTMADSAGWDPKNVVNDQAWELINVEVEAALANIEMGKSSPLAYHMVRNQMNMGMLASYVGFSRLRVWWHLKPAGFKRMTSQVRKRYADTLNMTPDALNKVPDHNNSP